VQTAVTERVKPISTATNATGAPDLSSGWQNIVFDGLIFKTDGDLTIARYGPELVKLTACQCF
jgi:hypothetical protein